MFVCGSTGEGQSLAVDERMRLAERWVAVAEEAELEVIIQVGHNCQPDAVRLAAHAAAMRATERERHADDAERHITRLGEPVTFLEAIAEALWEELERDPDVFLMGEDIGTYGGLRITMKQENEKSVAGAMFVNRFGKQEEQGRGFAPLIAEALDADVNLLVKGSRSMRMERVVEALRANGGA